MPKLPPEVFEVIGPYVEFRFSHKTKAERSHIRTKIIKLLKADPQRQEDFVEQVTEFMLKNEAVHKELRRLARERQAQENGLSPDQVNENQGLIAALVKPMGGDMNAVMERILMRVGNDKQHHG